MSLTEWERESTNQKTWAQKAIASALMSQPAADAGMKRIPAGLNQRIATSELMLGGVYHRPRPRSALPTPAIYRSLPVSARPAAIRFTGLYVRATGPLIAKVSFRSSMKYASTSSIAALRYDGSVCSSS